MTGFNNEMSNINSVAPFPEILKANQEMRRIDQMEQDEKDKQQVKRISIIFIVCVIVLVAVFI